MRRVKRQVQYNMIEAVIFTFQHLDSVIMEILNQVYEP